jgi:tripartite-type tricarboxylate transporter receptor subunit TctC
MSFTNPIIALAQARAGKVRALAVTTPRRAAATPEIPTMIESGAPGVEVASWFALLAPAGTPRDIVNRLNAVTVGVLGQPEIRSRFEADGSEAVGGTPDQLGAFMRSEWTKWSKVIKAIGLKME